MINLYYDKIVEGIPAPNGAVEIALTDDARRVPYVKNHTPSSPIAKLNTFYFVAKANKTVMNLYTDKPKRIKNLFYPIELSYDFYGWNRSWVRLLSPRAKQLIRKNRMKLLLLAPRLSGNAWVMQRFKERIDELVDSGIPRNSIYIVLGEIRNVYRNLLDTKNVYGIDWWQIYMQLVYKVRHGQSSLDWISDDEYLKDKNSNTIDYESWDPSKIYNINYSTKLFHDVTLLVELLHRRLTDYGYSNFNKENYNLTNIGKNLLINPRASIVEKNSKEKILDNLKNHLIQTERFENYQDSLFTIVCDINAINSNTDYKQEISSFSLGPSVWQQIAIGHPMVIVGCASAHEYLNNQGYFSCNSLINQSYDSIYEPTKRIEYIRKNIENLINLDKEKIQELILESIPFLKKNREIFLSKRMQPKFLTLFVDMRYE